MSFWSRLFGAGVDPVAADAAYAAVVAQARSPALYREAGVPDTPEGRYDMIGLHAFLLFHRLAGSGPEAERFSQAVFNRMAKDFESNLRAMGISDITVPRHMKKLARGFYGRLKAYRAALDASDDVALAAALERNLLAGEVADRSQTDRLVPYVRGQVAALAGRPTEELVRGLSGFVDYAATQAGVDRPDAIPSDGAAVTGDAGA